MKSKRSSNKIYYYIDLFFILLPILYVLGYCLFSSIPFFKLQDYPNVSPQIIYGYIREGIETNFVNAISNWCITFEEVWGDTIIDIFSPIIYSIYDFLGLSNSIGIYGIIDFLYFYSIWLMFYEFFSLLFNIIMWLPRWCRNKVRDWNGSDSV